MYYTYENGKLVAKGDQYENPSSYIQYGTNETGMNGGKANGWEQGISDTASGVMQGMGLGMWEQLGKAGYNGLKSTNSEAGDFFGNMFAPHHTWTNAWDEYGLDGKKAITPQQKKDRNTTIGMGVLDFFMPLVGSGISSVIQGKNKRAKEASANYINNTNPFLFAIDDKGLQFANPKAKAPSPVGDKTGWIRAVSSLAGSAIKKGIDAKKAKNEVAPNTEVDLNQDQPKNLAFMQNPLGDNPAVDNSYKESATRFDINRGDNGRDFMYQDKTGAPWDQTFNFKKGGKVDEPSVTTTVGDVIGDKIAKSKDNVAVLNSKLVLKDRSKEPTFELTQDQQLLPETNTHLEFDPIGLKKGTYFTRPRQRQDAGSGNVVDYFDSKTGKLLKTMNYNKGGSVQVKGGNGNDDIALVDTNTGEDTGVRVEKDEMIVFSKKNVEALEKAIASGKKSDVFNIVKDQLSQHPEVKEGETMFAGGGKLSKGAQLHLDNPNIRSEAYLRGAYESALKSGDSTDMADYNSMREAHEHILKMDSIKGQERKKEIDSLKSSPKILDKIHGYGKDLLGFSGGGKYKGLSDAEIKQKYHDETAKPFGQVVINNLWDLEKEMDSRKMPYKEWHYLSDEARKAIDDFVAVPANTVKGVLWDIPLAMSEKVDNYGDPIKDPKGYEKILQTKVDQLYEKKYGKMGVDLGGLKPTYDRKKWKELEADIRAQDIEKAKKGENVNKVMPSDNEKPTYKDRNVKDALGMLFPDAEKAVQDAKNKKDGIPVVKLDLSKDNKGQSGWSKPNTRTSTSSTTTTTTSGQQSSKADNVNIDNKSIAMKGVAQPDPSMLNVADIAGKLQTPYAKTVDTAPETVKQDWLGDTLGYAGDALKLGLGMSAATKKLPEWTISDNWNEYMGKMKFMSNMGLTPEQKAQYLDTADRTYQYDLSNIYNLSNGNAGTVLGNIGRANMSRYRSGVDLAIADKNAELANNAVYGNWLGRDEQYRKSIFDENRNGLLMTKQAGMQLASDAIANMENRADYNKFYGKGSQVEKLQNLQLEEQQYNNDILKAQRDNAKNPDFWKTYNPWKTTSAEHQVATTNSINKDDATEQSGPKWNSKITDKILSHERSFGAPGGNPFFSGYNNSDWSNGRFEKEYVDKVRSEIPNFDSLPDKIKARLVDYKFNTGRSVSDLIHVASGKYTATDANNKKTLGNLTEEQIASLNSEDFGKKIDNAKLEIYKMTKQNDVNYKKNLNMNWIPRTNMWDNFEF